MNQVGKQYVVRVHVIKVMQVRMCGRCKNIQNIFVIYLLQIGKMYQLRLHQADSRCHVVQHRVEQCQHQH